MKHSATLQIARGFLARSPPVLSNFGWLGAAAIIVPTVMSASARPMTGAGSGFEHVAAFAAVEGLFALGNPVSSRKLILYAILGCVLIEALQMPLATRHAWLSDLLLNATASVLVICVVAALRWLAVPQIPKIPIDRVAISGSRPPIGRRRQD